MKKLVKIFLALLVSFTLYGSIASFTVYAETELPYENDVDILSVKPPLFQK